LIWQIQKLTSKKITNPNTIYYFYIIYVLVSV